MWEDYEKALEKKTCTRVFHQFQERTRICLSIPVSFLSLVKVCPVRKSTLSHFTLPWEAGFLALGQSLHPSSEVVKRAKEFRCVADQDSMLGLATTEVHKMVKIQIRLK